MKTKTYPIEVKIFRDVDDGMALSKTAMEQIIPSVTEEIQKALRDAVLKDKILIRDVSIKAIVSVSGPEIEEN